MAPRDHKISWLLRQRGKNGFPWRSSCSSWTFSLSWDKSSHEFNAWNVSFSRHLLSPSSHSSRTTKVVRLMYYQRYVFKTLWSVSLRAKRPNIIQHSWIELCCTNVSLQSSFVEHQSMSWSILRSENSTVSNDVEWKLNVKSVQSRLIMLFSSVFVLPLPENCVYKAKRQQHATLPY